MKTKRFLVGVDGSAYEAEVVDAAVALAGPLGAKIHLVRAVTFPAHGVPYGMLSMAPDEVEREMLRTAQDDLEVILQRIPAAQRGEAQAVIGAPVPVIEKAAEEGDVDLIVIGARGHGMIDRLLGSIAGKIVNHANRSVIVVRDAQRLARP